MLEDQTAKEPDAPVDVSSEESATLPDQHGFYKMPAKFGHIPVAEEPLGWDPKRRFEHLYPHVRLPSQVVERFDFGNPELEPNRLFFGDNLHVMRSLPSESIDLIYIDPPFFSQQTYNVLFGDQNELRSFKDIWEGGLNGYLVWLNARLYEMKRLLRKNGVLFVHVDAHAAHYVKVELDKLFGYDRLVNEVVWRYRTFHGQVKGRLPRKHDTLLIYGRGDGFTFHQAFDTDVSETIDGMRWRKYLANGNQILGSNMPMQDSRFTRFYRRWKREHGREPDPDDVVYEILGQPIDTVWDIKAVDPKSSERIGYPTQKPEELLERVIEMWTDPDAVVADFFCGGGTAPAVAQRTRRRWIAVDISRVAVSITADRVAKVVEQQRAEAEATNKQIAVPNFEVAHWGIYEIRGLSEMAPDDFRQFILLAYEAREDSTESVIHGYKGKEPIHVGSSDPDKPIRKEEIAEFANAVLKRRASGGTGTVIAWAFTDAARKMAERIAAQQKVQLEFVKLRLIPIESPEFAAHVTSKHERYADLVSFVLPPSIRVRHKYVKGRTYRFDASESVPLNQGAKLINVQWDFDYQDIFTSSQGYELKRDKEGAPVLSVEYEFDSAGEHEIAVRVQDDLGGEAIHRETITVG